MEKMPYRSDSDASAILAMASTVPVATVETSWRHGLPTLTAGQVVLRQLRTSDAASLFSLLTTEEVSRFISPPPSSVEGFERFIAWTGRQRLAGAYACFAITVKGMDTAVGIFQLRELEPGFGTAEWGFAIGSPYWGTGAYQDGAELLVRFAFEQVGVHRLEARAAVRNGRGNGALRKIGAVQEGLLRKSFLKNGEYIDQALWTILVEDWQGTRGAVSYAGMTIH